MQPLIITLALTGLGYIATLLYTYTLLGLASPESIGEFNRYESVLLIISSLVSLGITQDAARNISISKHHWLPIYKEAQGFRLFTAIVISIASASIYLITRNEIYLLGVSSIAMALSGDFALYAVGRPVAGSIASLVRQLTFSFALVLLIFGFSPDLGALQILTIWAMSFIFSGYLASKLLSVNYLISPSIPELKILKRIGLIAILVFLYNNIKPGFILLISERLTPSEAAYYFEAYKIYFIIFSVRRVVVQTLYKKIITEEKILKYDFAVAATMASMLIGLWGIRMLIDQLKIDVPMASKDMFVLISMMTMMSSIFPTSFTKLFSLKRDSLISIPIILSALLIFTGLTFLPDSEESVKQYLLLLGASEIVIGTSSFYLLRKQVYKK